MRSNSSFRTQTHLVMNIFVAFYKSLLIVNTIVIRMILSIFQIMWVSENSIIYGLRDTLYLTILIVIQKLRKKGLAVHMNRVNRVIGSLNAYIMSKREREMMLLLIIETDKRCILYMGQTIRGKPALQKVIVVSIKRQHL